MQQLGPAGWEQGYVAVVDAIARGTLIKADHPSRSIWGKRVMDVVLGVPLCVLAAPVIVALAVVLALQLRANPFFVHNRIGHGGRTLRIPKLRTLCPSTPTYADKTVTTIESPTRFAEALRRTHLDELPQLFLVPLGQLSLVGPRPVMLQEAVEVSSPRVIETRCQVRQGCTGLWQVSVAQGHRVLDHPEYAFFYVVQRTVRMDVWILWRTGLQMLGASPITLDDVPAWTLRNKDTADLDLIAA